MDYKERLDIYNMINHVRKLLEEIENVLDNAEPSKYNSEYKGTGKGKLYEWKVNGDKVVHCLESFCEHNYYYQCTKDGMCEGRVGNEVL